MLLPGMAEGNDHPTDLQQETDEQMKKELGAFEITARQREAAKTNEAGLSRARRGTGKSELDQYPGALRFYPLQRLRHAGVRIGLYHTSGLSTPSQAFMALMSLTHLVNAESDPYIILANETVKARYAALMNALGLPADDSTQNTMYYTLVNVQSLSEKRYGADFAAWLLESRTEIEFLDDLAAKKGVVLMYGPGFDAPEGTVRISLANLNEEDYVEIARMVFELQDDYYSEYKTSAMDEAA